MINYTDFYKILGKMTKDGVQGKVMEVSVVLSLVVIVVYKVLNVVMGADVLYVLRSEKIFSMKSHSVKMPHKEKIKIYFVYQILISFIDTY